MKKIIFLAITFLSFFILSCNNEVDDNNIEQTNNLSTIKARLDKELVKEFHGELVTIKDLNLINTGLETFESKDLFSTNRLGTGDIIRKFDENYQLHEISLPINIYNNFIKEGIEDSGIVVLMTPGEYLDKIGSCFLSSRTPVQLKVCIAITTMKMLADCINATPETESIHCW